MTQNNVLIYILRRDLRLEDNPVFHALSQAATAQDHTHLLPVYVFAAQQVEVSGFIPPTSSEKSPYPQARSPVGNFWRCGPHRGKFLGESVWDLKESLQKVGSNLDIKVGMVGQVVANLIRGISDGQDTRVSGVWMTCEEGVEEKREEKEVKRFCDQHDVDFKLFTDEKYFVDDRDLPFQEPKDLNNVFTSHRKLVEPLRERPRPALPTPSRLLPFPTHVPSQHAPFSIPSTHEELQLAIMAPLIGSPILKNPPPSCPDTPSAHPFVGGSKSGLQRTRHLLSSASMTNYKATRNGLLGTDFSTKLSAWLALGCITSRQIHESLLDFENGELASDESINWMEIDGYGNGENDGTKAVRFELLWRDYMRLCTRKFGPKLFAASGFKNDHSIRWRSPSSDPEAANILSRFLNGTTGMGLIDASQRELFLTGYTSNRARQNVASFLAKHLGLDWRLGAEWYESMLVDYDVSSNWGNWQYVAGVGNDPRGEARVFNPVKQGWDYDSRGEYVLAWIPELREADAKASKLARSDNSGQNRPAEGLRVAEILQAWEIPDGKRREDLGLNGYEWVRDPLKKIVFTVGKKANVRNGGGGGGGGAGGGGGKGKYRGGSERTGGEKGMGRSGGYTSSRGGRRTGGQADSGYANSHYGSGGGGGYNGRGYGGSGGARRGGGRWSGGVGGGGDAWGHGNGNWQQSQQQEFGGGRQARTGMMEKAGHTFIDEQ